jgi:hypothetical protein
MLIASGVGCALAEDVEPGTSRWPIKTTIPAAAMGPELEKREAFRRAYRKRRKRLAGARAARAVRMRSA